MERKERLHLLLAYGFMSLFFGFATVLALAFVDFPFNPGSFAAALVTLAVFTFSFYCSGKVTSRYMKYSEADVRFIVKLAVGVGITLMVLDIIIGGAKVSTLFSNLSFLMVFYLCTKVFLKPKHEDVVLRAQQQVAEIVVPVIRFTEAMLRKAYYRVRNMKSRYIQAPSKSA